MSAGDGFDSMSFEQISKSLTDLSQNNAADLHTDWYGVCTNVHDALTKLLTAHDKLNDDRFWSGAGPSAAQDSLRTTLQKEVTDDGLQVRTYKMSAALAADAGTLNAAATVPSRHKLPDNATDQQRQDATFQLAQDASRSYTTPMDVTRPQITDDAAAPPGGPLTGPGGGSSNGGSNNGQGGGGASKPTSTDGATKPQDFAGDGQQQSGQGQGSGQGGGSGSGGSGSGSGGSGLGSGLGSGRSGADGYSPSPYPGATHSAGYSPAASTGTGGPGSPGALRPGMPGIPGAPGGTGTNPAGIGASGIRGGAGGFGPMGMAGMGGAHARGQGEDDEDHEIPDILINVDNGNALFGLDDLKASPGVIGNWEEQAQALKQQREAEKRRYKSLGWDVDFGDEK